MLSSSRKAAALLDRFCDVRYAIMDLCLVDQISHRPQDSSLYLGATYNSSACRDVKIWLMMIAVAYT